MWEVSGEVLVLEREKNLVNSHPKCNHLIVLQVTLLTHILLVWDCKTEAAIDGSKLYNNFGYANRYATHPPETQHHGGNAQEQEDILPPLMILKALNLKRTQPPPNIMQKSPVNLKPHHIRLTQNLISHLSYTIQTIQCFHSRGAR